MMTKKIKLLNYGMAALICLIFLSSCGIKPTAWTPATKPNFEGKLALNEKLTNATKIHLLGYYGAEEFAIDKNGDIYCGVHKGPDDFSSGAILKIKPDDSIEEFLVTQ